MAQERRGRIEWFGIDSDGERCSGCLALDAGVGLFEMAWQQCWPALIVVVVEVVDGVQSGPVAQIWTEDDGTRLRYSEHHHYSPAYR